MNDAQTATINEAWSVAMVMYACRESVTFDGWADDVKWDAFHQQYLRWVRIWETLFNSALP